MKIKTRSFIVSVFLFLALVSGRLLHKSVASTVVATASLATASLATASLATTSLATTSLATTGEATTSIDRDWVMHIYVRGHLYEDRLHLEQLPAAGNQWKGSVTVPGLFTASLRNISYTKEALSFDIEADEGHGLFHVKYVANFYPGTDTFSGFATLTDSNTLLGGFVVQRN